MKKMYLDQMLEKAESVESKTKKKYFSFKKKYCHSQSQHSHVFLSFYFVQDIELKDFPN
jgi:hypothetical protein